MLMIPMSNDHIVRFVGIDPGSNKLGLSLIHYDMAIDQIVYSYATTLVGERMSRRHPLNDIQGERAMRLLFLGQTLLRFFNAHQPLTIACESPYFNHLQPSAYGPLVESITMIKQAAWEYHPWRALHLIDPSSIKKSVGVRAQSGVKDDITQAILRIPEIVNTFHGDISQLDEHGYDSLAVNYCSLFQHVRMYQNATESR